DRADKIITVARGRFDQPEQHQPQFTAIEHPPATPRAVQGLADDPAYGPFKGIAEIGIERIEAPAPPAVPGTLPMVIPVAGPPFMSMSHKTILRFVSIAIRYILECLSSRSKMHGLPKTHGLHC